MMKNPFVDIAGDISSTRIFEAMVIVTVIIIAFISVLTGKDLGVNVANMLQFITSIIVTGCEAKKAVEYWSDQKENE